MRKNRNAAMLLLVLVLAAALSGCSLLKSLGRMQQKAPEAMCDGSVAGIYVEDGNEVCLAFDPQLPGIGFSGAFDKAAGVFTAADLYACTTDGQTLRLYRAEPPRFAADFSHCDYELSMRTKRGDPPGKLGEFVRWDGGYGITYVGALAASNQELGFSFRKDFLSLAFSLRGAPAPTTQFVPEAIREDVGTPVANSVINEEGYYARSLLSGNNLAFYDAVYAGAAKMKSAIDVKKYAMTVAKGKRIIQYLMNDAPELFWCSGSYTYTYDKDRMLSLRLDYGYQPEDAKAVQERIDAETADILKPLNAKMSQYEKFMHIYTELAKRITYDKAAAQDIDAGIERSDNSDQSIVGGLDRRKAVCAGISRSLQYLLHKVGIPCFYVSGSLENAAGSGIAGPHAWTIVELEGEWYHADLTSDMPGINAQASIGAEGYADFLMTEKECLARRTLIRADVNENPSLPVCDSNRFDAFVRKRAYFETYDAGAKTLLKNHLYTALTKGQSFFTLSFKREEDAKSAAESLGGGALTADIPAFDGFAVCGAYTYVDTSGIVTVWPVYRMVPAVSSSAQAGARENAASAGRRAIVYLPLKRLC